MPLEGADEKRQRGPALMLPSAGAHHLALSRTLTVKGASMQETHERTASLLAVCSLTLRLRALNGTN